MKKILELLINIIIGATVGYIYGLLIMPYITNPAIVGGSAAFVAGLVLLALRYVVYRKDREIIKNEIKDMFKGIPFFILFFIIIYIFDKITNYIMAPYKAGVIGTIIIVIGAIIATMIVYTLYNGTLKFFRDSSDE